MLKDLGQELAHRPIKMAVWLPGNFCVTVEKLNYITKTTLSLQQCTFGLHDRSQVGDNEFSTVLDRLVACVLPPYGDAQVVCELEAQEKSLSCKDVYLNHQHKHDT